MFSLIFASSLKTCWSLSLSKCICPVLFAAAIIQILVSLFMKGEAREGVSSSHWNSLQSLHGNSKLWRGFEEKGGTGQRELLKRFPWGGRDRNERCPCNYDQCTRTSRPFNDMCCTVFYFCAAGLSVESPKTISRVITVIENIKELWRKSLEKLYKPIIICLVIAFLLNILLDFILLFILLLVQSIKYFFNNCFSLFLSLNHFISLNCLFVCESLKNNL